MEKERSHRVMLMICYKFPPMQSVSCKRTWNLYLAFRKYFDHVVVLSTSNRHILSKTNIDTTGVDIIDIPTRDYRTVLQANSNRKAVASEKTKKSAIGQAGLKLQSSFPTLRWFGEGGSRYIRNGTKLAEQLISEKKVTHVFSSYPPYADHLIAFNVKKKYRDLFWIADFRDLHVDPVLENQFLKSYQLDKNRKILGAADVVSTVSDGLAVHLKKLHHNVLVARNGIAVRENKSETNAEKFTITYTGSMFQDKRNPDRALKAIRRLIDSGVIPEKSLSLRYAGKDSDVWVDRIRQFNLAKVFKNFGFVSEERARELQEQSHINLLLTYSTNELSGNLTGKLYDYLAAGRPVLVLINGPEDAEISNLIKHMNAGAAVSDATDDLELEQFVKTHYVKWKNGEDVGFQSDADVLHEHTWDAIAEKYLVCINQYAND